MTVDRSRRRMVFEIARWEFLRFFKPRDLVVTLLVLVAGGAAGSLVFRTIAGSGSTGASIAVVDTDDGAAGAALEALAAAPASAVAPFVLTMMDGTEADAALDAGEVDAVARPVGSDVVELRSPGEPGWAPAFADVLTSTAVPLRLQEAGVPDDVAEAALAPVRLEHVPAGPPARGGGGGVTMVVIVMMFAIFTGTGLLFTVITGEKALRVTEVVVSTVSPQSWIDGKILGTSLYVVVYMLTYALGLVLLVVGFGLVGGQLPTLPPLVTDPVLFAVTLAFATLGFGLWFTLFAAIAATVNDPTTSARGSFIMLPGVAIASGFLGLVGEADGLLFRILSHLPLTSPSAMPVRLLVGTVAWWEVAVSLALLAGCLALVRRAAGRVFALGILMIGKEPTLAEMVRWARRA